MSEEGIISEEEKEVKILELIQTLSELGENTIANQLFKKIEKKITFVLLPDWMNHQICESFPKVDTRDLVFCCSPSNNCPYRAAVLKKMGLTKADYIEIKKELADTLDEILEVKLDGKDKSD
jgi:hypothetical protein